MLRMIKTAYEAMGIAYNPSYAARTKTTINRYPKLRYQSFPSYNPSLYMLTPNEYARLSMQINRIY